ncbi:alpha/beta hydrolase [Oceanobacillus piezotolerans]|uniref:Alpha/beta hydrolase n=1 Tax=Oceanobacillus piezotolerans TaxID=2448030 RepID=A0A498D9J8_9BACI|nr:alpha/beta hydrolase [Oceanobacillus piezotolerans]RLL41096.1 alpha/beta hydrolase [Oceanobacillus piezotolerans]
MPYYITDDGIDIYYECIGNGEPLVFIHGLGASSEMYKPQVEYFKKEFKVVIIDLRGNGKSGKLECLKDEVLDTQIKDVIQILDHLEIEQSSFVGVSYGGVFIQKFAITYPNVVNSLIISDSFCDTSTDSLQKALAMFGAKQTWILRLPNKWLAKLTTSSYKNWPLAGSEMKKVIVNMRKRETILQRKTINNIKLNNDLSTLDVPVLCLVGDNTKLGIKMMEQVSNLTDGELVVIEDSFDPSNLCQPTVFNTITHEFLQKVFS